MNEGESEVMESVNALVDEYRARCLWFLREDYYPETTVEACRVLEYIERHGDSLAFRKASTLRQWLLRDRDGFVEAEVSKEGQSVVMQWAADSAFRFFPLIQHQDFGLTLHPFDLATNKVLALVGRLEARDWIDVINCHDRIQRLGYLAWAASGKDPGFSPAAILEQAGRSARYSKAEIDALSFAGPPPDAGKLSESWHAMLNEARELIPLLPPAEIGKCVLDTRGNLYSGHPGELRQGLKEGVVRFHEGRIYGAFPIVRDR